MTVAAQLKALMKAEGFWLVRQRKHMVWTDGVVTVTTSVSPSCPRVLANVLTTIRRTRHAHHQASTHRGASL